ncbi:MAG: cytochrome c family protein [Candidatus Zixiibacteriota bacterium]
MKKLLIIMIMVLVAACIVMAQDKPAAPAAEKAKAAYVGAEKCKMCHKAEYEAWSTTKHAKAFEALKPEEQAKPECTKCHVTGATAEGTALNGVQCEACHGAGSEYKKPTIMSKAKWAADPAAYKKMAVEAGLIYPVEANCVKCHTKEGNVNFKEFTFATMKDKVHPVKAAAEPAKK